MTPPSVTLMLLPLAFVSFVAANPGFAAVLIGGLFSLLGLLVGVYYKLIYQRLGDLERADAGLVTRVGMVERQLEVYQEHVGAGDKALVALSQRIERHMQEEEQTVWAGLRDLSDKLTEIQIENTNAHAEIVTKHGNRLATIEAQLGAVQRDLPNGDLREVLTLLKKLATA